MQKVAKALGAAQWIETAARCGHYVSSLSSLDWRLLSAIPAPQGLVESCSQSDRTPSWPSLLNSVLQRKRGHAARIHQVRYRKIDQRKYTNREISVKAHKRVGENHEGCGEAS